MARALALLGVAAAFTGCLGSDDEDGESLAPPSTSIRVVRDDGSLPAGCGPQEVATRVVQFLDAIGRGDEETLDELIADADRFQWVFWNGDFTAFGKTAMIELPPAGQHRDGRPRVLRYLRDRRERLRLLHLEVSDVRPGEWLPKSVGRVVGLSFTVERDGRLAGGKGAVACSDSKILVWSMGVDPRRPLGKRMVEVCGPRKTPREGAVVCTE